MRDLQEKWQAQINQISDEPVPSMRRVRLSMEIARVLSFATLRAWGPGTPFRKNGIPVLRHPDLLMP